MRQDQCPFCEIVPERIVSETRSTLTIRDAFPVSPGHTLVIPKRHFGNLFDATPEEVADIWRALQSAANSLIAEYCSDGFNVGINVGVAAGQTVMHLHVHLIPRYAGDQPDPRGGIRRIIPQLADYWSQRPK